MQATQNIRDNRVERLNGEPHSGDTGGGAAAAQQDGAAIEGMQVVSDLINEESQVRYQAEQLEGKARELEHDGDDGSCALAGQLRAQAGFMLGVAAEIGQAISEIKADPHKKISRRKVEHLRANSAIAMSVGEEEIESAEVAHAGAVEHKEQKQHHAAAELHAAHAKTEKKPCAPKHEKKPVKSPSSAASKKATVHGAKRGRANAHAPEVHPHTWVERAEETLVSTGHKIRQVASSAWHRATDACESLVEGVTHFAPLAAAAKAGKAAVSLVLHPIETTKKLYHAVGNAKRALWAMMPDWLGHEDAPATAPSQPHPAVAQSAQPLVVSAAVVEALGKLALPVMAVRHVGAGDELPLPMVAHAGPAHKAIMGTVN